MPTSKTRTTDPLGSAVHRIIDLALDEDLSHGDITTESVIDSDQVSTGYLVAKQDGIIAGLPVVKLTFEKVDEAIELKLLVRDGDRVKVGQKIADVKGPSVSLLKGERTALNFLQRMSGIATETSKYVAAVSGTKARLLDTRKTMPGHRALDKYAVRMGGGYNHRYNLGDGVLLKDNHIAAIHRREQTLADALSAMRKRLPHLLKIEVEVTSREQAKEALAAGAEAILLDNMSPDLMAKIVKDIGGRVPLEASGGITLSNIRAVAETGVDMISVGALTHSVKGLDISLELTD